MTVAEYEREIDEQLNEIARVLSSDEAQGRQNFSIVQALVGSVFTLQQALTAADSAILAFQAGDANSARSHFEKSVKYRAESTRYLAQWVRAELGVDDGGA